MAEASEVTPEEFEKFRGLYMEYKETRQDSTLEEIFKMWDRSETGFIEVADWIAV